MSTPRRRASKVYTDIGAAIHGEKIAGEARKLTTKRVKDGSSRHRIQRIDLETDAFCVIDKAFRIALGPEKETRARTTG